jgi:hypothetical protein
MEVIMLCKICRLIACVFGGGQTPTPTFGGKISDVKECLQLELLLCVKECTTYSKGQFNDVMECLQLELLLCVKECTTYSKGQFNDVKECLQLELRLLDGKLVILMNVYNSYVWGQISDMRHNQLKRYPWQSNWHKIPPLWSIGKL